LKSAAAKEKEKEKAMFYEFDGRVPSVAPGAYVSETALVIGDVRIGKSCYVGHGAILRGDYGTIEIGEETAVEEGVIVHAPPGECCSIGTGVVLGHGAIVHARLIADYAGIGMGAVLSIRSEIGRHSVVAEGGVVKQGQVVPESVVVAGNPARKVKDVTRENLDFWTHSRQIYVDLAAKYLKKGMKRLDRT
jgi:carbonic anhydrase/acetyltransferase-like protein (isoleucine patch superfamily)